MNDAAGRPFRALRRRDYRRYCAAQLVSLFGTWMQTVAQAWLVYRLTGSPLELGLITFSSQIPLFALGPLAGVLVDQLPRRKVLFGTQALASLLTLLLAILTLTHHVELWHIHLVAQSLGVVNAFDVSARQAFALALVGRADLPNAIALNSSMFNLARMCGPALGGFVVVQAGEGPCFLANAASYIGVIVALLSMGPHAPGTRQLSEPFSLRIKQGLVFVCETPSVRTLFTSLAATSLLSVSYTVLLPVHSDRVLHLGAEGVGTMSASAGAGALGAALLLAARRGPAGLERWIVRAAGGHSVAPARPQGRPDPVEPAGPLRPPGRSRLRGCLVRPEGRRLT